MYDSNPEPDPKFMLLPDPDPEKIIQIHKK